jgi:hypothetical protein
MIRRAARRIFLQNFFEFVVTSDCFSIVSVCDNPLESNTFCLCRKPLAPERRAIGTILAASLEGGRFKGSRPKI